MSLNKIVRANLTGFCLISALALLLGACSDEKGTDPVAKDPVADKGGLLIKSPNGGESFKAGDTVSIQFGFVDPDAEFVEYVLDLMKDGNLFMSISTISGDINDGAFAWKVPAEYFTGGAMQPMPAGDGYKVRIRDYTGAYEKTDESDGTFSITH